MPTLLISPWQRHQRNWMFCDKCSLAGRRTRVVLARGQLPAEVVFCGEAPGPSEDILGEPFIGPAGKLLDEMLAEAGYDETDIGIRPVRKAFTNVVACIPLEEVGQKFAEPPKEAIAACAPRLEEFWRVARPKMIVWVGGCAKKWGPKTLKGYSGLQFDVMHPAAILRMDPAQRSLERRRATVILAGALDTLHLTKGL